MKTIPRLAFSGGFPTRPHLVCLGPNGLPTYWTRDSSKRFDMWNALAKDYGLTTQVLIDDKLLLASAPMCFNISVHKTPLGLPAPCMDLNLAAAHRPSPKTAC